MKNYDPLEELFEEFGKKCVATFDFDSLYLITMINHFNDSKNKKTKTNRVFSDIDPYGEENWEE